MSVWSAWQYCRTTKVNLNKLVYIFVYTEKQTNLESGSIEINEGGVLVVLVVVLMASLPTVSFTFAETKNPEQQLRTK